MTKTTPKIDKIIEETERMLKKVEWMLKIAEIAETTEDNVRDDV